MTVMPPGEYTGVGKQNTHWSLPVVRRIGHKNGRSSGHQCLPRLMGRNRTILGSDTCDGQLQSSTYRRSIPRSGLQDRSR